MFRPLIRRLRELVVLVVAGACAAVLLSCQGAGDGGVGETDNFLNRSVTVTPDTTTALSYVTILETAGDATSTCIGIPSVRCRGMGTISARADREAGRPGTRLGSKLNKNCS